MNLNDYEKKYFSTYAAFAETVRFILEKVFLAAENLPLPQSAQCRAKGIEQPAAAPSRGRQTGHADAGA